MYFMQSTHIEQWWSRNKTPNPYLKLQWYSLVYGIRFSWILYNARDIDIPHILMHWNYLSWDVLSWLSPYLTNLTSVSPSPNLRTYLLSVAWHRDSYSDTTLTSRPRVLSGIIDILFQFDVFQLDFVIFFSIVTERLRWWELQCDFTLHYCKWNITYIRRSLVT